MSPGLSVIAGSGAPPLLHDPIDTLPAVGLVTRMGAVVPARFRTLTRNRRDPPSTSAGCARPGVTLTRLSGLMVTSSRTYGSRGAAGPPAARAPPPSPNRPARRA